MCDVQDIPYNFCERSSFDHQTPCAHLKHQTPEINGALRFDQALILDEVSVALGPWSGCSVRDAEHTSLDTTQYLARMDEVPDERALPLNRMEHRRRRVQASVGAVTARSISWATSGPRR